MSERTCKQCHAPLPAGVNARRLFCNRRCINVYASANNAAARRASTLRWEQANPQKVQAMRDRYRETSRANMMRYFYLHREVFRANTRKYRATLRGVGGPGISQRDWLRLCTRHGGSCAYCAGIGTLTIDHVVPISRGGWHAIGNVLPACKPCNSSKRDRLLVEWRGRAR